MQNKNGFQANFGGEIIFGIPGKDGGYYLVNAEQINANTLRLTFTPSQDGMTLVNPVDINLPGATDEQIRNIVLEYLQNNPAIGQPGKDGFSPVANVTQTATGATVTITDKNGTTVATITNGKDGEPGKDGEDGYTPIKEVDYFDGKDGVTPDFSIGTVETLEPGSDATASISGTKENPVLNLGIPQGLPGEGESGGGEVWELINEVTITEPVQQITITSDIKGMPFNLKKMYFVATVITPADADRGTVRVMLNGATAASGMLINAQGMSPTYGRVVWAYIDTVLKFHLRMQGAGTDSINFVTDVLSTTEESITRNILNRKDVVEKIVVEHTSTMAANSKIKIMGVRA